MTKSKSGDLPVGSILEKAWELFTKNIKMFLIFAVITLVLYAIYYFVVISSILTTGLGIVDVAFRSSQGVVPISGGIFTGLGLSSLLLGGIISVLISTVIMGALSYAVYGVISGKKIEAMDCFKMAFKKFWVFFGASILVWIIVGIGMMFLIVPGLIAAIFLIYTFYVIAAEDTGVGKALSRSFELAKKSWLLILIMGVIAWAAMFVLGFIPFINFIAVPALYVLVAIVIGLMYKYAKTQ